MPLQLMIYCFINAHIDGGQNQLLRFLLYFSIDHQTESHQLLTYCERSSKPAVSSTGRLSIFDHHLLRTI